MSKKYTQEEVEALKAKYPNVIKEVDIYPSGTTFDKDGNSSEDPVSFIIRKPSKSLLNLLNSDELKGNANKSNDAIISNCVLLGDRQLIEDDASVFSGLIEVLAGLIQSSRVELKKA